MGSLHSEADFRANERMIAELLLGDPWTQAGPVRLFFMHLGALKLVPKWANQRLQIRARYGGNGRFREKYSQKVRSSLAEEHLGVDQSLLEPQNGGHFFAKLHGLEDYPELNGEIGLCVAWDADRARYSVLLSNDEIKAVRPHNITPVKRVCADLDTAIIFPWSTDLQPQITLALRHLGFYDSTIAEAVVRLPSESWHGSANQELLLYGKKKHGGPDLLGHVEVSVELRQVSRSELLLSAIAPPRLSAMLATVDMYPGSLPHRRTARERAPSPSDSRANSLPRTSSVRPVTATGVPVSRHLLREGSAGATPVVLGRPIPDTGSLQHLNHRRRSSSRNRAVDWGRQQE